MLSSKQVFVLIWTVVWVIRVDGIFIQKKKDVLKLYSNFVVDKTQKAMKISAHEVKFLDRTEDGFDFRDEQIGQENEISTETSNEITNDLYYDDDEENNLRSKRQVNTDEATDMTDDPAGGDFKETFMTMVDTVVDGAKTIADKFSEAFSSPEN